MKPIRYSVLGLTPCNRYICNSCIIRSSSKTQHFSSSSPRHFSPSTTRSSNPAPPPRAAFAFLPTRRLISLTGPDSAHYLQGVITNNLSPATPRTPGSGFYAAFLNAQGRLLHDVFIYPLGEEAESWLIEVDAKEVDRLAKHIKRYKLRAKFDVRILAEDEGVVYSIWGHEQKDNANTNKIAGCIDSRAPNMGRRLILSGNSKPELDLEEIGEQSYRVRRYLMGVPEGQDELVRETALPQESNVDIMGGIDYRKGCYVGQELTIRTHHTGVVRKRILPISIYSSDEEMPNTLSYNPEKEFSLGNVPEGTGIGRWEKKGRSAGKFVAGVGNIGLGLCRLEIMTDIRLGGDGQRALASDEFKVEWGGEGDVEGNVVKVKAFVPEWFREGGKK